MDEDLKPGLSDWVASLLNSAAVVLWGHLGNRGNWAILSGYTRCVWNRGWEQTNVSWTLQPAFRFDHFLHVLLRTYVKTWTLVCLTEKVRSRRSGLLILKCQIWLWHSVCRYTHLKSKVLVKKTTVSDKSDLINLIVLFNDQRSSLCQYCPHVFTNFPQVNRRISLQQFNKL